MGADLTTADKALKEFYEPALQEELNNDNVLLSIIESTDKNVEGREVVLSLHVSRNKGIGARASGGTLPTAGNQGYTDERVRTKRNYGRIEIDGELIRTAKSDQGSFVRAVDSETQGVVDDLKRDYSRQLWGDGTGRIATCGTTTASTTVVLAATTPASIMNFLEVGSVIDIGTSGSSASVASSVTVTDVDPSNHTITISGSAISTTSSNIVSQAGSYGNEITGLQAIVAATGTLHNVNPSTYSVWKSYVDSTGGNPTELKFQKGIHETRSKSGKDIKSVLTTAGVYRGYYAQLQSRQRFVNTQTLDGGFEALTVSGGRGPVSITWDRDCPDGEAYGLNTDFLKHYRKSSWEFMQEDGAVLSRVQNKDAYEATLFMYSELATTHRNTHAKWTSLTES